MLNHVSTLLLTVLQGATRRKAGPVIQRGSPVRIISKCIAIYMMLRYLASYTELVSRSQT